MVNVQEYTKVYLRGVELSSDYLLDWNTNSSRVGNLYTSEAVVKITKEGFDALLPDINDSIVIYRGSVTGLENRKFIGTINKIEERDANGYATLVIRDPLYYYQFMIFTTSYDSDIDVEGGDVGLIATDIIEDGGETAFVSSTAGWPIRKRMVIRQKTRYEILNEIADYLNWQIYFDHSNDRIAMHPYGYNEYSTVLEVGVNVINQPVWKLDKTKMRNYIYVNGAFEEDWKTFSFVPDGSISFTLPFECKTTEVDLDGNRMSRGITDSTDSFDYYVKEERGEIIFNTAPSGTLITVNYVARIPIVIAGGNDESISRYGRQDEKFDFKDIVDVDDGENRQNYLLNALGWPIRNTNLHIVGISDLEVGYVARVVDINKGKDFWLPVQSIVHSWPQPYDMVTMGDLPYDIADVVANLNKRLRISESLEQQNTEILTIRLGGSFFNDSDTSCVLEKAVPTGNYYDEGLLYDDGELYDTGVEIFSDLFVDHNQKAFFTDLLDGVFEDSVSTTASVDRSAGTVSFSSGQVWKTGILFEGFSVSSARLSLPSDSLTGGENLTYEISNDNESSWEEVSLDQINIFSNNSSEGVVLRITSSGVSVIDFRADVVGIPKLLSLEVNV